MKRGNSLRLRLLLAAALGISISAVLAASTLLFAFRRHAETLASKELEHAFVQLASGLQLDSAGTLVSTAKLSDPRFEKPYGGLYWQINGAENAPLRSPSLFDDELPQPQTGESEFAIVLGPHDQPVYVLRHPLQLAAENGQMQDYLVTMAVERSDIDDAETSFKKDLLFGFALLAVALFTGAVLQLWLGLKPLRDLQAALVKMVATGTSKVEGSFPSEVQPLVSNLNDMLAERELALERARQRASNMAHGIKTPITILMAAGEDMEAAGRPDLGKTVTESASLIREQIDRQLARARMASGHAKTSTPFVAVAKRVVNALSKTPEGERLTWQIDSAENASIMIERHDLFELLGNLADNARKWAKTTVHISYSNDILRVEDDGPGVPDEKLKQIVKRGFKLDTKKAGHGLGLSIAGELVESYGLTLKYERSSLGGLSVSIGKSESFAAALSLEN